MLAGNHARSRDNSTTGVYLIMSDLVELSESAIEMVAGGQLALNLSLQSNINVNPQVAVGVAVLSPHAHVNANNLSFTLQINAAAQFAV
jgi:hypothetical protein